MKPSNSDHLLTSYEYQALPDCRNRADQRAENPRETISDGAERERFRFLGRQCCCSQSLSAGSCPYSSGDGVVQTKFLHGC
uniref:Uncharacterized protein n=1 Tax=Zea mays TaxID=4577 RepID=C0PDX1_MAIZE|nr:unknown [Zea mays]